MDIEKLMTGLVNSLNDMDGVESVGRIDGENAIGVETTDGDQFFLTIDRA